MRIPVLAALLVGCSSPVIVVIPPDSTDTGSTDTGAVDTGSPAVDTGELDSSAPSDTGSSDTGADVGPETSAPTDTGPEVCAPLEAGAVCTPSDGVSACGPAPDGCGGKGKVDCGGCPSTRRCAAKSTDPVPHCTCETMTGTCVLYSGEIGRKVKCGPIDAPLAVGSTLIPQPDGSITVYCIPSGA